MYPEGLRFFFSSVNSLMCIQPFVFNNLCLIVPIIKALLDRTDLQSQERRELSTPEEATCHEPESRDTGRSPPLRKNQHTFYF